MLVQVVAGPESLKRFEEPWNELYEADPEGHFFLSWPWMSRCLAHKTDWLVLVARRNRTSPIEAVLPLRWRRGVLKRGTKYLDFKMAGRGAADYTGFLCLPGQEERALPALARHLKTLRWRRLDFEYVRTSDFRLNVFLEHFQRPDYEAFEVSKVNSDGIDNSRCPYTDLPGDWESYLAGLSANSRQKLRRLLRAADAQGLRVTHADARTFQRDLDILLTLWAQRWGDSKGPRLNRILRSTRRELADALDTGNLFLPVLWDGDRPLGAFACLVDHQKRELLFQMAARDPDFDQPSPGLVLHAHAIRWAIEQGLARYDFLRGDEPYKYSFADKERIARSILVKNRGGTFA